MTDTTVAEEKKPLTVPIDDDNDAEDSDDGAPEIAATDGQSHLSHPHCGKLKSETFTVHL